MPRSGFVLTATLMGFLLGSLGWVSPSAAPAEANGSERSLEKSSNEVSDTAATSLWLKARSAWKASQYKDAEDKLTKLLRQYPKAPESEEALVLLTDAQLRLGKYESATKSVQRFRQRFTASVYQGRIAYFQGLIHLKAGRNVEAARALSAAVKGSKTPALSEQVSKSLQSLVTAGGLSPEEMRNAFDAVANDARLGPWLLERVGETWQQVGRYAAAKAAAEEYLRRYPTAEGAARVRERLRVAETLASQRKTLLVMAPMTGDYADVGRSLKEGVGLAVEEARTRSPMPVEITTVDDQGNMILGVQRLRKAMVEEGVDAIIGPAMSDVSAAVAVDLSARNSPIPMITPTATTHGIAGMGEGIFQLNVTTLTLGQTIAAHAVDCLKLKDFAIVAPKTEYGYQLAEAFTERVEQSGGKVHVVQYYDPDEQDLAPQFQEVRRVAAKVFFDQRRAEGIPDPEPKLMKSYLSDSTFQIDGLFLPAINGEEAYRVASQSQFNKIRAQLLGSSGWYDKALLHKSSPAAVGGTFSVDFPDNPKTDIYQTFSRTYQARYKRPPDRVAALSYDAARLALEAMAKSSSPSATVSALHSVRSFAGVLGPIQLDEKTGANQSAALFKVDRKGFTEVAACTDTTLSKTAGVAAPLPKSKKSTP